MLPGQGLARPGGGAPSHGQVALGAKSVAQVREPGPMEPGTLNGPQVQRNWLRRKRHLAMAWRRRRQRAALARPGQAMARQHIFENDG